MNGLGRLVILKARADAVVNGKTVAFYHVTWVSGRPGRGVDDLVERVRKYLPFRIEVVAVANASPFDVLQFQRRCSALGAWIYGDWYYGTDELERFIQLLNDHTGELEEFAGNGAVSALA